MLIAQCLYFFNCRLWPRSIKTILVATNLIPVDMLSHFVVTHNTIFTLQELVFNNIKFQYPIRTNC